MSDEREQQMLALMQEATDYIVAAKTSLSNCLYEVNKMQNTVNELWAEWTRTHGLKGIPGKGPEGVPTPAREVSKKVVRRSIKR